MYTTYTNYSLWLEDIRTYTIHTNHSLWSEDIRTYTIYTYHSLWLEDIRTYTIHTNHSHDRKISERIPYTQIIHHDHGESEDIRTYTIHKNCSLWLEANACEIKRQLNNKSAQSTKNKNRTYTDWRSSTVKAEVRTAVKRWQHMAGQQSLGNSGTQIHYPWYLRYAVLY